MDDYVVTHTKQINAFFPIVFAVIDPFNGEMIAERFNRLTEGYAMLAPIPGRLVVIPFELYHRILITSSSVNCPALFQTQLKLDPFPGF
jgi:hypothetical protein